MKTKKIATVLSALAACAVVTGCGIPSGGSVNQNGKNVYPVSSHDDSLSVLLGDVMPFYDDGVMNIYHLQNSRGTLSQYFHPISRLTTTDYVSYTDEGIAIDFEEKLTSPDAALGTGSFIKGKNGEYHCFYTGHNSRSGLAHTESIRHAISRDGQKTWEKQEDFTKFGDSDDFRDPYVYYDDEDELYYMLVTTNKDGCGVIQRYAAESLDAEADEWEDVGVFFKNDSGTYNMECPSYLEYNGYYYLMYSEQGDNRVTHYRYRTENDGEWKRFERDYFDSTGFYAGRPEKAEDKLYAFAWCAKLTGGSTGDFDWGGNLVAHELKQLSDGSLCAVMPGSVRAAFGTKVGYSTSNGKNAEKFDFDGGFSAYAAAPLSSNVTRIEFKVCPEDFGGDFGITFGLEETLDNRLGSCVVAFDVKNSKVAIYNDVSNVMRYGSTLAEMPFVYDDRTEYSVEMLIDGEIFTVYVDGTIAVTGRCTDMIGKSFAFYSNGAKAAVKEIAFYE